jgi:hypothetical protein
MTSFLVNLEQHYPAVLGIGQRISAVARAFNMDDRDIYGFLSVAADAAPTYIAVPIDGAYIDKDLALDPLQALATRSEFGATFPGNKLLNRRFFRFTVPANTQPQLEVRAAEFEDFTFSVFRSGTRVRLQTTGTGGFGTYTLPLSPVDVDYVMEVHSSQRAAQFKLRLCPGACTP